MKRNYRIEGLLVLALFLSLVALFVGSVKLVIDIL